ncbi:hypothetical protein J2Y58_003780 [Sphingomonas sp. BE138]|nr:YhhA family cyclophane-containing RiPP [Sphingomonas sp. BE138]MDR6790400.1 hypothetical protein [Sphingomonas sp. BE138]
MEHKVVNPPVDGTRVKLDSVALSRLMDEVRNNTDRQPTAYNRMHNRHNR